MTRPQRATSAAHIPERNWLDLVSAWLRTHRLLVGIVCGVAWTGLSLYFTANSVWQILAALLGGAIIAVRRTNPGLAMPLAWLVAGAQMLPPGVVLFLPTVAILVALTAATHFGTGLTRKVASASVPVGTIVATVYLTSPHYLDQPSAPINPRAPLFTGAMVFVVLGAAWLLGTLGAMRDRYRDRSVEAVISRRETSAERERANLARDMHDVLAHSLSVMISLADGARLSSPDLPVPVADSLRDISGVGRESLTEVRTLLARLRSPSESTDPTLNTVQGIVSASETAGLAITCDIRGTGPDASTQVYQTVTHLLREALTNALRHGDSAQPVFVTLDWTDSATLTVRNSQRAQAPSPHQQASWGILGMQERVALLGGTISAGPLGRNWQVAAELPLTAQEQKGYSD